MDVFGEAEDTKPLQRRSIPNDKTTLIVSKLAYDLTEEDVKNAFNIIPGVQKVNINKHAKTQRSVGFGTIKFENEKLAKRARAEMDGLVLHDRPIRLRFTDEDQKRIKPSEVLFIKNLPYKTTESQIMYLFTKFHPVRCALMRESISRKSLGYGFIRFYSIENALEALKEKNGTVVDGRKIKLAFSESSDEYSKKNHV
ncbi:unnamed protein product [Ambrosiozyma monospora]|uniref:Unnamed protein product n=1 Tax=Ambrosiozyma monospora TaxID=43982 RepID=A0A9W6YXK1_AMBMO|nr:unnamed protein product [Ambrosiozyma monospora]